MTGSGLVTIIAIISLLAVAATVVGGSYRNSRATQVLTLYRESAQAWEQKATLQQGEIEELQADSSRKDKQIADLQGRLTVLQDLVTGKTALEQLLPELHQVREDVAQAREDVLAAIKGRV